MDYCKSARHAAESLEEVNRTLTKLLTTAVAMGRRLTLADRGSLFIVVPDGDKKAAASYLWSKVAEGETDKAIRVAMGTGIAGTVAASGDSVNVADA